jgi:small-conductance mechanosensitive channel
MAVFQHLFSWMPDWAPGAIALAAALLGAWALHVVTWRWLSRVTHERGLFFSALVQRTKGPTRLWILITAAWAVISFAPFPGLDSRVFGRILQIAFIVLVGWSLLAALHVAAVVYSRRFKLEAADNLIARRHLTQIRILERTAAIFITILTLAAALMTVPAVRQYGVSLLASAGAAGIIAGLALQPLLTNLIAGVQIAMTQPIRIDDAVVVDNEWGWIEEIGATYVTVRLWDWRRMILPLSYFIQQPFQNWTRQSSALIGTAMFYVDYRAPLEEMRKKLEEIVKASPKWDGDVVSLQVTDLTERTMQVRCLASARNSGDTFDLRCEIREKMIAFLRKTHPDALPQSRLQFASEDGGPPLANGDGLREGSARQTPPDGREARQ